MVFHWCLYNKQNITCPLMDMNFIFSWSTRYLTRSLRSLVRYRVDHSKIKFISTRGHVISSIYNLRIYARDNQVCIDIDSHFYLLNRRYSFRHFCMGWQDKDLSLKQEERKWLPKGIQYNNILFL